MEIYVIMKNGVAIDAIRTNESGAISIGKKLNATLIKQGDMRIKPGDTYHEDEGWYRGEEKVLSPIESLEAKYEAQESEGLDDSAQVIEMLFQSDLKYVIGEDAYNV